MIKKIYDITPIAKPRMTRSDKWKKRECVEKYWDFCNQVKLLDIKLWSSGSHIIFMMPMPQSWSKKKKKRYNHKPHEQKPDKDNLIKSLLDAVFKNDAHIWSHKYTKIWGYLGKIIIIYDDYDPFDYETLIGDI